jgi:hypothetical protein
MKRLPEIRAADIASLLVVVGLGAQGYGLYEWLGMWCPFLVVGTEVAVMGLVGVLRHAG